MAKKLTAKQARFVDEYLVDACATQAAIRAGYRGKNVGDVASKLLGKSLISAAIEEKQAALAERTSLKAEKVLEELGLLALSDIGDILDFSGPRLKMRDPDQIPEAARRTLSSVKLKRYTEGKGESAKEVELVEFKLHSKTEALRELARHFKLVAGDGPQVTINNNSLTLAGMTLDEFRALSTEEKARLLRG